MHESLIKLLFPFNTIHATRAATCLTHFSSLSFICYASRLSPFRTCLHSTTIASHFVFNSLYKPSRLATGWLHRGWRIRLRARSSPAEHLPISSCSSTIICTHFRCGRFTVYHSTRSSSQSTGSTHFTSRRCSFDDHPQSRSPEIHESRQLSGRTVVGAAQPQKPRLDVVRWLSFGDHHLRLSLSHIVYDQC